MRRMKKFFCKNTYCEDIFLFGKGKSSDNKRSVTHSGVTIRGARFYGFTRVKFGKQQNCDNTRSMTINGGTVSGVDCFIIMAL